MKILVFSVYDAGVHAYMPPFYARARGEALRSFTSACNDENSNFRKFSGDYTLYFLGEFDDAGGTFLGRDPERVISANQCITDVFNDDNKVEERPSVKRLPM